MRQLTIRFEGEDEQQDSGIYRLTFSSGMFYIGKSIHITERWKQHFDKFKKGKAAENMQREFNRCGYPEREVLVYCHPDHIDIVECYLIQYNARTHKHMMLNTTYADAISDHNFDILERNVDLLKYSTPAHVSAIEALKAKVEELANESDDYQAKIEDLNNHGVVMPDYIEELERDTVRLENKVRQVEFDNLRLQRETAYLKSRNWWQRLLNK